VERWLTDSRILKYKAIPLERDDLTVTTGIIQIRLSSYWEGKHKILWNIVAWISLNIRPKLGQILETPFLDEFKLFLDGSSKMIQGKRHNGYSVVDREKLKSY
jgi:hypothetical protein